MVDDDNDEGAMVSMHPGPHDPLRFREGRIIISISL